MQILAGVLCDTWVTSPVAQRMTSLLAITGECMQMQISVNLRNRDGSNVSHILNFLNLENLSYKKKENELEMFGFESF